MKKLTQLLACSLFLTIPHIVQSQKAITPYFSIRSQGLNSARHLIDTHGYTHELSNDHITGSLWFTPGYGRTFKHHHITQCLLGDSLDDCSKTIRISGTRSRDRQPKDLLADYFYLPNDFVSTVKFEPIIDNFMVDFNMHLNLDRIYDGLYARVYAPFVHTRWDLNIKETIIFQGANSHESGYFSPRTYLREKLLNHFIEYANGVKATDIVQGDTTPNDPFIERTIILNPLKQAKMSQHRRTRTRLADVRWELGYHLENDQYQAAAAIHVAAPTGNRPDGRYLFEPIAGNGKHWEIGANVHGNYRLWTNENEEHRLTGHLDATITHMIKTRQRRTFDLKNGQLSRYMLAQKMTSNITGGLIGAMSDGATPPMPMGTQTTPSHQFANEFTPVANLTTMPVDVKINIQADISLMINYTMGNIGFDAGYNLWARSCEDVTIKCNPLTNNTTWALKGDAHVIGRRNDQPDNNAVALSATQSTATIHKGTNFPATGASTFAQLQAARINPTLDNIQDAFSTDPTTVGITDRDFPATTTLRMLTHTSINPIFIKADDVRDQLGRTKGISHKIFGSVHYRWREKEVWVPHLGIGGEVEVGSSAHSSTACPDNTCDACVDCTVTQWGLWIKGGISFE